MAKASLDQLTLAGDVGRRSERVEWGVQHPAWPGVRRAGVDPAADREHAESIAELVTELAGQPAVVVSRSVVTYTTRWAPAGAR